MNQDRALDDKPISSTISMDTYSCVGLKTYIYICIYIHIIVFFSTHCLEYEENMKPTLKTFKVENMPAY